MYHFRDDCTLQWSRWCSAGSPRRKRPCTTSTCRPRTSSSCCATRLSPARPACSPSPYSRNCATVCAVPSSGTCWLPYTTHALLSDPALIYDKMRENEGGLRDTIGLLPKTFSPKHFMPELSGKMMVCGSLNGPLHPNPWAFTG